MKPHHCNNMSAASKLAMKKDSHTIAKFKPKIRIIHIFPPEIIKTDVANFRELVQSLTGKPAERKGRIEKTTAPTKELTTSYCPESIYNFHNGERVTKESEEKWGGENSSGWIGDMHGLIQDLPEFPLLPLKSYHYNIYGGKPFCQ